MASSSSSNAISQTKHDVFISFRGVDVRDTFLSHLKAALKRKQLQTFTDDQLNRGKEITPSLLQAIEESTASIIIFSENYADSPWCLDELLHILHCSKTKEQYFVLPVFYGVDPTDVEEQTGSYGDAFQKLKKQFKKNINRVETWRSALKEAANISGLDSKNYNYRPEDKLIEIIVEETWKKVGRSSACVDGLVGIYSHVENVQSLLRMESQEILFIGIWGMGGVGKTTTAEVLFCEISHYFDGCCFIRNVREEVEKHGLTSVLERILSTVLQDKDIKIQTITVLPHSIINRLRRIKVLIVLDDVSDIDHLQLARNHKWFGPGSRVIITGRNKRFMNAVDEIYEIKELPNDEAFKLFCLKAFKLNKPPDKNYELLSSKMVGYAKGVPLALIILGSLLNGKEKKEWESKLEELKKFQEVEIQQVLETSFDALDENEKKIFLDIACFFKGQDIDWLKGILDGCGFFASYKISCLIDKCLLTIVENKVEMHDLLQEMGCTIVRQESEHPGKRNRMWVSDEIMQVFTSNTGTSAIEGISLYVKRISNIKLNPEAFLKMDNLRLLEVYDEDFCTIWDGDLQFLPNTLRYFHWDYYPWKSLPSNFCVEKIVYFKMQNSNKLQKLWSEKQCPQELKYLNLSYSLKLTKLPSLSFATNLERIILDGCKNLEEISLSIQQLNTLNHLSLQKCQSMKNIPSLLNIKSLKFINLNWCSNLEKSPEIPENVEYLGLLCCKKFTSLPSTLYFNSLKNLKIGDNVNIKEFPEIFGKNLKELCIQFTGVEELPSSIGFLSSLVDLKISFCTNLKKLPEINGLSLKYLFIEHTGIEELPFLIGCMSSLVHLRLCHNTRLETLPSSICGLSNLECLDLSHCRVSEMPSDIGNLSSLKELILGWNNFERLPESIKRISTLEALNVQWCRRLVYLPELSSSISCINARGCVSLEKTSLCQGQQLYQGDQLPFGENFYAFYRFNFWNCIRLDVNSRKNIVATIYWRIHDMARKLLKLSYESHHKSVQHLELFLPGCIENSEWFEYQNNSGSLVIIPNQSHDWSKSNGNYAGLTFFVHIENVDRLSIVDGQCNCRFKTNDSDSVEVSKFSLSNVFVDDCCMVIWYENILDGRTWCNLNEASFEFEVHGLVEGKKSKLKAQVKKCGIHVVYAQDETQLINYTTDDPLIMTDYNNEINPSGVEEEEEEEEPNNISDDPFNCCLCWPWTKT